MAIEFEATFSNIYKKIQYMNWLLEDYKSGKKELLKEVLDSIDKKEPANQKD